MSLMVEKLNSPEKQIIGILKQPQRRESTMRLSLFAIYLLFGLTIFSFAAEASVSLGAAPKETPGLKSNFQAMQLKSLLGKYLGEKVELRLFANRAEILRQIEATKIDLAIVDPDFLETHSLKLVVLGPLDKSEKLLVVSSSSGERGLSQRVARALVALLAAGEEGSVKTSTILTSDQNDKPTTAESPATIETLPSASSGQVSNVPLLQASEKPLEARPASESRPAESLSESNADAANSHSATPIAPPVTAEPAELTASSGSIPEVIAQPNIPFELRPPNIPVPHPRPVLPIEPPRQDSKPRPAPPEGSPMFFSSEEGSPVLVLSSEPWGKTKKPEPLLPEVGQEPNVIYVVPFITLMVPVDVSERIFDEFVDTLNKLGTDLNKKFVVFKNNMDERSKRFLETRRHVTGEIYGYVEESGCCSTNLKTRVKLAYYSPRNTKPILEYADDFKSFFDHDHATLLDERKKLADRVVSTMTSEMLKTLRAEMVSGNGREEQK